MTYNQIMKKFLFVLISCYSIVAVAQDKKWTLRECVEYALENNISVKQGQNTLLSNEQDIKSSTGNFFTFS